MSEKKYRLNIDFKTEKEKQLLYAVANICGLRKQYTNIDLYIHALIDYRDVIEALYTSPSELEELEIDPNEIDKDLTEALNRFLQTFEKLSSFLRSVFSKIRKIRSGKHDKT
ncbi:MAG: hypothetical protein LM568_01450 [Desulfurococcaceae archaeon]|nr:hypothetical protein [Desulfurococcaceae archaeon]